MKINALFVAAVLAISHPAVASTNVNDGKIELCKQVESVAAKIMKKKAGWGIYDGDCRTHRKAGKR